MRHPALLLGRGLLGRARGPFRPIRHAAVMDMTDRHHAAGGQGPAGSPEAVFMVKGLVAGTGQAVGTVVHVQQDRVELACGLADHGAHVARLDPHARIRQAIPKDGCHVLPGPADKLGHDLGNDKAGIGGCCGLGGPQGETHAQAPDQHLGGGPA